RRILARHEIGDESGHDHPEQQPGQEETPPFAPDVDDLAGLHVPTRELASTTTTTQSPSSAGPPLRAGTCSQRRATGTCRPADMEVRRLAASESTEEALDRP